MRLITLGAVAALATLSAVGCKPGSKMPSLNPVKGRIMKGSTPVHQAVVRLTSDEADPAFAHVGTTDPEGNVIVSTIEAKTNLKQPGVPAGTYKVVILLPMDREQRGGGEIILPDPFIVKPGENILPAVDVTKF